MITTFGGGVGAGKFLEGLYSQISKKELNIIVNTADDIDIYDVRVSPDVDSVFYWLSGMVNKQKGWGIKNDTFNLLEIGTWSGASSAAFAIYFQNANIYGVCLLYTSPSPRD